MSVLEETRGELERLNAPAGSLAALALAMAAEIDGANSATSKSMCGKVLMDVMKELRALAPPVKQEDRVDEIRARRERRLRGAAH